MSKQIEMDIESSDLRALGGKNGIKDKPKIAICIYHKTEDIVKLSKI